MPEHRRQAERRGPIAPAAVVALLSLTWAAYGRRWLVERIRRLAHGWTLVAGVLAALLLAFIAWQAIPPASIAVGGSGGAGVVAPPAVDAALAAGAVVIGVRATVGTVAQISGDSTSGGDRSSGSKADISKEIVDAWDKGSFNTEADSIRYHVGEHGKGRNIETYTREGIEFYKRHKSLARPHKISGGRMGVKIRHKKNFGIYAQDGKLISFE